MNWKKLLNKVLYPPVWLMTILAVICTVALIYTFMRNHDTHPVAYITYILSFYTLSVIILLCIKVIPEHYKAVKKKVYDHPVGERFMTDIPFRTHVSLYTSLTINILYAITNLFSGICYKSVWSVTLAVYHLILAVMRFILVRYVKRNDIGAKLLDELRTARICAGILMSLNLALSGVVVLIIKQNKSFIYNGILIYVMAMYTFYITTNAIINLVKYKIYKNPVMSTAKIINMAAALVSMLSLETAMLFQFGTDMDEAGKTILIAATGAGVSIIVVTMAIYSIVITTDEINKIKKGNDYE